MSIQINGINVIDNDRNVSAAGIVTIGSGNSTTIINGTTGITSIGIGVTIEGVSGNISIAGTITAAGFNIPANIVSFDPANGATDVDISTLITITFDQAVGIATTGFVFLREGSAGGVGVQTLGTSDILATTNGIVIKPNSLLGYSTSIFPVVPEGFILDTSGASIGINTTDGESYSFTSQPVPPLGDPYEGGFLICCQTASSVRWVVAPESTEVSRNFYFRNDAVTNAEALETCGDWFIPTCVQLKNPGYACRTYWDSYCPVFYWSSTQINTDNAWGVCLGDGNTLYSNKNNTYCVRAFRCVTY